MKSALVIGYGQIGKEIVSQLSAAGVHATVATRSGRVSAPAAGAEITHIRTDAANHARLLEAAAGSEVVFACAHAPYDSRQWAQVLPPLEETILDVAKELGIPVVFPESVYAYAGLGSPIRESSPFAPVEEKGRIRQQLMEARAAHGARTASVIAGDLIGRTAQPGTSVVRMCISDRVRQGRRAVVPARIDVAHGITVIADLAAAMIAAAQLLKDAPAGADHLFIAPSSNPTLNEITEFTHEHLGSAMRKPLSLPRWTTRVTGAVQRSMYELHQLSAIWYSPCVIESGEFADALGTTDWREGVKQML